MSDVPRYVEVLVWPAVALVGIFVFQDGVNGLIRGNIEVKAFGVYIKGSPSQVEAEVTEKANALEKRTAELLSEVGELKGIQERLITENNNLQAAAKSCSPLSPETSQELETLRNASKELSASISQRVSGVQEAANRTRFEEASRLEKQGFEALIDSAYEQAVSRFSSADEVYPTFHNVHEIAKLLSRNLAELEDPATEPQTRRIVLDTILTDYSWGMPSSAKLAINKELAASNN